LNKNDIADIQAEAGIIATIINKPEYTFFSENLKPNHFTDKQNAYIYYAIAELAKKGIQKIDAYNITNILNAKEATKKQLETITIDGLNDLINCSTLISRDSPEDYMLIVQNVLDKAFRREILSELQKCEKSCFDDTEIDIKTSIYDAMDKVMSKYVLEDVSTFGEKVDDMWSEIQTRFEADGMCGCPSMITSLNDYFTYEKSELVLVCAHRKEGKSMYCLNEAVDKLKKGLSCVYFDTEMSSRQHLERMLSHLTKIPVKIIKNGKFTSEQGLKIKEALAWIKTRKYVHVYMPTPSKEKIFTIVKRLKSKSGLDFVFYDYIKSQNSTDSSVIYNIMGEYTDFLKNKIAGELDIPVLAAAQLNRGGDIADSYKLEQFSSVVAILKRKKSDEIERDGRECGNYKFYIKLNRLGEQMSDMDTEYVDISFDGNTCTFEEAKQHEVVEPY
jgi:replicative DNA helicase